MGRVRLKSESQRAESESNDLPKLVKQRYGTELQSCTLTSIKPEISQALCLSLDELQLKSCSLCKEAHRPDNHFFSKCPFLPPPDKAFIARAQLVAGSPCLSDSESEDDSKNISCNPKAVQRVHIMQSPCLEAFHGQVPVRLTIDSGATVNMIRAAYAIKLGFRVSSSTQSARQANGSSPLKVVGKIRTHFQRDRHMLFFDGLVVENLDSDILAGIPFMECNNISICPARHQVCVGSDTYEYGTNGVRRQTCYSYLRRLTRSSLLSRMKTGISKHDHVRRFCMTYILESHTEQAQLDVPQAVARKPSTTLFSDLISLDPDGIMTV
ncbi:Type III pantothenate kinase [Labeo rohita]|uniref:Type III pantothenate kinase n=1 Tax=Labeo rohita TaxID=84645 RepID=A0ABQ8L7R8_LABRO|nr:Type III pantothenate kinase [Labeo rohita]